MKELLDAIKQGTYTPTLSEMEDWARGNGWNLEKILAPLNESYKALNTVGHYLHTGVAYEIVSRFFKVIGDYDQRQICCLMTVSIYGQPNTPNTSGIKITAKVGEGSACEFIDQFTEIPVSTQEISSKFEIYKLNLRLFGQYYSEFISKKA